MKISIALLLISFNVLALSVMPFAEPVRISISLADLKDLGAVVEKGPANPGNSKSWIRFYLPKINNEELKFSEVWLQSRDTFITNFYLDIIYSEENSFFVQVNLNPNVVTSVKFDLYYGEIVYEVEINVESLYQ